jgi:hypothetical protein
MVFVFFIFYFGCMPSAMKKKNVEENPKMYEDITLLNSHIFVG